MQYKNINKRVIFVFLTLILLNPVTTYASVREYRALVNSKNMIALTKVEMVQRLKDHDYGFDQKKIFEYEVDGDLIQGYIDNGFMAYGTILIFKNEKFDFAIDYSDYVHSYTFTQDFDPRRFKDKLKESCITDESVSSLKDSKPTVKEIAETLIFVCVSVPIGALFFPVVIYNHVTEKNIEKKSKKIFDNLGIHSDYNPEDFKELIVKDSEKYKVIEFKNGQEIIFGVSDGKIVWKFQGQYFPRKLILSHVKNPVN